MIKFFIKPKGRGQMGYKVGVDKKQLALLPTCMDDYVPEEHICRVINAFTEQLDMSALGYKYAECKSTGCRPYDPRMMLNLYIYGYLHRVRSSRRLRDEARRNVEVMWLMEGLTPDDKTISNFRKDNSKAVRETFRAFTQMCQELGLYGEEVVATDGTKFRANNALKNNHNKTVVGNELERIDKKINEYLSALEQGDKEEEGKKEPTTEELQAALERLKERKARFKEVESRIAEEGQLSTVDPDARLMHNSGDARTFDVGYNVQTVVDSKYHMIVDFTVTNNPRDNGMLHEMSEQAKEVLEVQELVNLADKGYYYSEDIAACEGSGVTCLVAKPKAGGEKKADGFEHKDFKYDKEKDIYICPCQKELRCMGNRNHISGRKYRIYANTPECGKCQKKPDCTKGRYREVLRLACQDVLDIVDERTRKNKELYRKRQEIVEHVFGTVKAVWGFKQFLCCTTPKVTAETALAYLAYNMRRTVNIFKEARVQPVFG
jgi:transposase